MSSDKIYGSIKFIIVQQNFEKIRYIFFRPEFTGNMSRKLPKQCIFMHEKFVRGISPGVQNVTADAFSRLTESSLYCRRFLKNFCGLFPAHCSPAGTYYGFPNEKAGEDTAASYFGSKHWLPLSGEQGSHNGVHFWISAAGIIDGHYLPRSKL